MHAIEAAALNKRFRRIHAVQDVTFQVPQGAVYALMGPNGAGKTTLIKLLMNLTEPSSGQAMMLGGRSSRLRGALLEHIGYVSENQRQPEWMTVDRFLRYWRPFYPTWDRSLEEQLVRRFELSRKQRLRHLSRGARMKVVLASVLAYRPRLIVMDEPLSGLDPLVRDELMMTLVELAAGTSVLISSHDLAEIDSFSTHMGYMDSGRLRISGPTAELRERFRKVTVRSASPLIVPEKPPAEWRNFQPEGSVARWTEIDFGEASSRTRAFQVFGEVQLQAEPMSLREIFLALARAPRTPSESEAVR
jgi:ABC-2 type transport system ATP-binding protein